MSRVNRLGAGLALVAALGLGLGCPGSTSDAPSTGLAASTPATPVPAPVVAPLSTAGPAPPEPTHVGSERCAGCHVAETERWRGSHHDLAMQRPTPKSVLGDFEDATFTHLGGVTRFTRRGADYRVETEGPDGEVADFEVAYVFGVEPLQQLLLAMPGGRLQAFQVAWDARPAAAGGQRWFALQPDERPPPGDVLHWSGPAYTWNRMCADCHSTGLERGYDADLDRYDTRWAEIDVACEACHGPGSTHVAWAEAGARQGESGLVPLGRAGSWVFDDGQAIAHRDPPRTEHAEIEVCAPCHARRSLLADATRPGRPLLDDYRPAFLDEGLYFADGQIQDEVYVWGSFMQSRMAGAGVTCSDCHDPHSLAIDTPDRVCETCHRPEVFARRSHHAHEPGSSGSSCVACHMPSRDYMVIDGRRDHSFRVPRPDVAVRIGSPDACSSCHAEHDAAWAAEQAARLWPGGRNTRPHPGDALYAARVHADGADRGLLALIADAQRPAIIRATALRSLAQLGAPSVPEALARAAHDPDPLMRLAAAESARTLPPQMRPGAIGTLLGDPARAVRIEAARQLVESPPNLLAASVRGRLAPALDEYRAAQHANAHTPEAWVNLGSLATAFRDLDGAAANYEKALEIGPYFVPAAVNLADVRRAQGREPEAEALLRGVLERVPDSAETHHALGLLLVRTGRLEQAVAELARAVALAPDNPRFAQVKGLAQQELERRAVESAEGSASP